MNLRHIPIIVSGLLACSLLGCSSESGEGGSSPEHSDLVGAKIVHEIPTRTTIDETKAENGGYTMVWSDLDTLGVLDYSSKKALPYALVRGAGSDKAVFIGNGQVNSYQAFYPYGLIKGVSDHLIHFNFPSYQSYNENDVPERSFPMMSSETASSDRIEMFRLFSVLKVSLIGDGIVSSIVLEANAPDIFLSGDATVDARTKTVEMSRSARNSVFLSIPDIELTPKKPTEFFLAIPAQDYPGGLKISVEMEDGVVTKDLPSISSIKTSRFEEIHVDISTKGLKFEDHNFKEYLIENYDENNDMMISEEEALKVTNIEISNKVIHSLDGIQNFPNLQRLNVRNNILKSVDISRNRLLKEIDLSYNKLETIDLSSNINLELIYLSYNTNLQSISLSNCTHLKRLSVEYNNLTNLDVSGCKELWQLTCQKNQLSELTLPEESVLKELNCNSNRLSSLVIHSEELDQLYCNENLLTSLDISSCPNVTQIEASANQFSEIEISGFKQLSVLSICSCPNLANLRCKYNPSLTNLYCSSDNLGQLDLEDCPSIQSLDITNNHFQSIDLKQFTHLNSFHGAFNQLTELDFSANSQLEQIVCNSNAITDIDISKCIRLEHLEFSDNPITNLDLTANQTLLTIYCTDLAAMKELDISQCHQLEVLDCRRSSLERIFIDPSQKNIVIYNDNGSTIIEK